MKKSIIAAGAASVALAAMPIVGAFAATSGSVIDNVSAVLGSGCTITNATNNTLERDISISLSAGETVDTSTMTPTSPAQSFEVTCNNSGWTVNARGTGGTDHATDLYDSTSQTAFEAASTVTAGTSSWAVKVNYTMGSGSETSGSYAAITAGGSNVVTATAATGTITPHYKIYAAPDQAAGTYEGQVTYTVAITD